MKNVAVLAENRVSTETRAGSDSVLLAHPAATVRNSIRAMLEADGCSVLEADDGYTALASLTQHEPDAVIADVMLSRLDGYQLCALIRSHSVFRKIPVILVASSKDLYDQARAELVGSTAYASQPFSGASLGSMIRGGR